MRNQLLTKGWLPLILTVTLLMRLPYVTTAGHSYDLRELGSWGEGIVQQGLFSVYYNVPGANYPPVYVVMLGVAASLWQNTAYMTPLLKLFPVLCETLMILAIAVWLSPEKRWRWIVPLCLALNPDIIATTALWGQAESVMTLFLVLALIALNRDKPLLVGVFYALALLTKFQSVVLVPLLVILMFRRYGWRALLASAVICFLIMVAVMLPFINGSGWDAAMRHYISAWYPQPTTLNAFNVWYWITPPIVGDLWSTPAGSVMETQPFWNGITYRHLGLAMVSLYTLLICVSMWRQYQQKREFLWAAALYMGFFMLATKMHERYVYPAVIFAIIGVAQDRRLWFAALGLSLTYLFNVTYTLDAHFVWLGLPMLRLLPGTLLNAMILLNVAVLLEMARVLFPESRIRLLNVSARAFATITVAAMLLLIIAPSYTALPADAVPTNVQFGNGLTLEGYQQTPSALTLYWRVSDEIPEDIYIVQLFTSEFGTFRLLYGEVLQPNNLWLHLSWVGRQLTSTYPVASIETPLYVKFYNVDQSWSSEVLPIRSSTP